MTPAEFKQIRRNMDMPKEIWMQVVYDDNDNITLDTWCENKIHIDDIKYIRADLIPQWQPIETAPKDGTYILIYRPRKRDKRTTSCVFEAYYKTYPTHKAVWRIRSGNSLTIDAPTHWMPLPQPPQENK